MDRQTALDRLELFRPEAEELQHPDFAEAWAYVEADEEAREIFARRQRQDREIARAMQAVSPPDGLKDRLLVALGESPSKPDVAPSVSHPKNVNRRWILSACVVLASCLLAAVGVWFWGERPSSLLTFAELADQAPFQETELAALPAFEGGFDPILPQSLWSDRRTFAFSSPAKGLAQDNVGADRVAVYEFYFRDPNRRHAETLRGVLLVVPKTELAAVPASQSVVDGNYTTRQSKPGLAVRAWSEGELVYMCLVPIQHFEALTNVFDVPLG